MSSSVNISESEILLQIYDSETDVKENVSEQEDNVEDPEFLESSSDEYDSDTDVSISSQRTLGIFPSKNGELSWSTSPTGQTGRHNPQNAITMTPGPTRYAVSHAEDIKSVFGLFITPSIENIVLEMTNLQGKRVYADTWQAFDRIHLQAYIGLLILSGVYRSKGEATSSLWNAETGRSIFSATMSLKTFQLFSRLIRFDDRETRQRRRDRDKLAAIREIWDKWVQRLPFLYNPGPNVTVDECLVAFRGRCPFRQYIPSKPAKYGIKIWAACDAQSSYAWRMQVYCGKSPGAAPEKIKARE